MDAVTVGPPCPITVCRIVVGWGVNVVIGEAELGAEFEAVPVPAIEVEIAGLGSGVVEVGVEAEVEVDVVVTGVDVDKGLVAITGALVGA